MKWQLFIFNILLITRECLWQESVYGKKTNDVFGRALPHGRNGIGPDKS